MEPQNPTGDLSYGASEESEELINMIHINR